MRANRRPQRAARRQFPALSSQSELAGFAGIDRADRRRLGAANGLGGDGRRCHWPGSGVYRPGLTSGRTERSDRLARRRFSLVLIGEIPLKRDWIEPSERITFSCLASQPPAWKPCLYLPADWSARLEQHSQYAVWLMSGPRDQSRWRSAPPMLRATRSRRDPGIAAPAMSGPD